jgi:polyferredoxin
VTLASLAAVSVVSYLDQIGRLNVSILGADPAVFFFALSFSVLWYLMFVTIPYTGNYNCVTMGWCYTGAIAQAFQKVGFFELRVKSRQVCRDCTTLDCAKSCPIGLVDMPGHFRQTGRFRSTKCCGVGNCVGACPYNNLYIHDIRHWVRDRLGARGDRRAPNPVLPMVRGSGAPNTRAMRLAPIGTVGGALPSTSASARSEK